MLTMTRIPLSTIVSHALRDPRASILLLAGEDAGDKDLMRANIMFSKWRDADVVYEQVGRLAANDHFEDYLPGKLSAAIEVHSNGSIGLSAYVDPTRITEVRTEVCAIWRERAGALAAAESLGRISPIFDADWRLRQVTTAALVAIGAEAALSK